VDFKKKFRNSTKVILVGDALMAPYELFAPPFNPYARGNSERVPKSGLASLQEFVRDFPASIWLNPEPPWSWNEPTIQAIAEEVPMFPLSLAGLKAGIQELLRRK